MGFLIGRAGRGGTATLTMRAFLTLLGKDFRIFFKDRAGVVLTFFVPMVLITIFGLIFGGGGGAGEGIRLLVVDEADSEASRELVDALREQSTFTINTHSSPAKGETVPLDREFVAQKLEEDADTYRYALIIPENFLGEGFSLQLELLYNPEQSVENSIVQGVLQQTLFSKAFPLLMESGAGGLTDGAMAAFEEDLIGAIAGNFDVEANEVRTGLGEGFFFGEEDGEEGEAGGFPDGLVQLETTQVLGQGKEPEAQSVGGWTVMFLLFSLTGAASSLFEERDRGLFQRILAGPVSRSQILWSKFAFLGLLGLLQMMVLFAFGEVLFGIFTSFGQVLPLLVLAMATAAAATAFGMLLASVAKTPAQANGLGTFFILTFSALGGAMFPIFMMPPLIRNVIAPLNPVYWAMDGVLAVLWRGSGTGQLLPHLGVLLLFAVVALLFALARFRRGGLFQ